MKFVWFGYLPYDHFDSHDEMADSRGHTDAKNNKDLTGHLTGQHLTGILTEHLTEILTGKHLTGQKRVSVLCNRRKSHEC